MCEHFNCAISVTRQSIFGEPLVLEFTFFQAQLKVCLTTSITQGNVMIIMPLGQVVN